MAYPINCPTFRAPFFGALVAFIALLLVSSLSSSAQSPTLGRAMKAQDAKAGTFNFPNYPNTRGSACRDHVCFRLQDA